jgi:hypothetical protein
MNGIPANPSPAAPLWWRVTRRAALLLVTAFAIGYVLHLVMPILQSGPGPAGFLRGVVHGALMPIAFPNLLVGNDVTIYAVSNTGLPYKLGYTTGVNACGAVFFGFFFWRLSRWRKKLNRQ